MQNPFRHEDRPERSDRDDRLSQGGDGARSQQRPEEYRTWGGGDGGRTAEAFRHYGHEPGYGQNPQGPYAQGASAPYSGERGAGGYQAAQSWGGPQSGQGYGEQAYGAQAYGGAQSFDQRGYSQPGGYGSQMNPGYGGQVSGAQTYGMPHYGTQTFAGEGYGGRDHASHGYAPGSQIWEGSGRGMGGQTHEHHDFEPDYLHWRQQQLSAFDKDYADWRNERREKFSSDFDSWRQSRPRTQAANPIVGDVTDGGTGNAAEAKKR